MRWTLFALLALDAATLYNWMHSRKRHREIAKGNNRRSYRRSIVVSQNNYYVFQGAMALTGALYLYNYYDMETNTPGVTFSGTFRF